MTFSTLQYYACRTSALILLLSGMWLLNKQFADYAFGTPHFQNLQASNVIQAENKLRGSGDWKITKPASNHEIEGFASVTSANPGEAISFYLNSNLSDAEHLKTKIDIYRMGWYEGKGGRLITSDAVIVDRQPSCPTSTDGRYTIECRWSPTHTITIPLEWLSGVYLAKLTLAAPFGIHGKSQRSYESYIIFVVRDDTRASHFVFQASVATYQAYNAWGGRDTYGDRGLSPDGRCWPYRDLPPEQSDDSPACAVCRDYTGQGCKTPPDPPPPNRSLAVSFNRPYERGYGSGDFFLFEYPMLKWIERVGYDVTYISDLDTDRTIDVLLGHRGVLSVGHDEYWSWEKRDHVERARDAGVSLGFFGANPMYWQVRFEPSFNGNRRIMVVYKHNASPGICVQWIPRIPSDPMAAVDPSRVTARWRDEPLNRPEQEVVGQMYGDWFDPEKPPWSFNLIIGPTSEPPLSGDREERPLALFQGTGLRHNDQLPGLVGGEFDFVQDGSPGNPENRSVCDPARPARPYPKPQGLIKLADSVLIPGYRSSRPCLNSENGQRLDLGCEDRVQLQHSNVTYYVAPSGARVFSAGTFQWSWGLENSDFDAGSGSADRVEHHHVADPRMQRWTANILNSFLGPTMIADFTAGQPRSSFQEFWSPDSGLNKWLDPSGGTQIVGDFMGWGQDQILFVRREVSGVKAMISYFENEHRTFRTTSLYSESNGPLRHFLDKDDRQLVGDFKGRGYDQVLSIDSSTIGAQPHLLDFSSGIPHEASLDHSVRDPSGWTLPDKTLLVGDFKKRGYDQVASIHPGISGIHANTIQDFSSDQTSNHVFSLDYINEQLQRRTDHDEVMLAGDFLCLGYDQILFTNKRASGPQLMIVDLVDTVPRIDYESHGEDGDALDGFLETDDIVLAGDFVGSGCTQVLFINNQPHGNRVLIAKFSGTPTPSLHVIYAEPWDASYVLNWWQYASSHFVGAFSTAKSDQVLFLDHRKF